jgi:radical SAM superfamily enzyme YgiQ (UPF0313 family)
MSKVEVLVVRPPRFYEDCATNSIFPEEVLLPTILEVNSISSRFLNTDFIRFFKKRIGYPSIEDYIFYSQRLKSFLKGDGLKWKYLRKYILLFNPKIVLLIPRMYNDFSVTLKTAKIIKDLNEDIKIGVYRPGNEEIQHSLALKYMRSENVDFFIVGEPEYTFLELCKMVLKGKKITKVRGLAIRRGKQIVFTKRREPELNLDNFPIPNRDLVLNRKIYPPHAFGIIEVGRGCIYNCRFCGEAGIPFRVRSPESIVREVVYVYKKYGTRDFTFLVSSFLHSKRLAMKICTLLKKFRLDIIFKCFVNANEIDEEIVKNLREAGCYQMVVGLESGSYRILKSLNKESNVDLEKMKKGCELIKKYGIILRSGIILNNFGETEEDVFYSLRLLKEVKPDFLRVQFLIPYLGSELFKKFENLIISKNIDEYHTGKIKISSFCDVEILRKIWRRYAIISERQESLILRKIFFNPKILKSKLVEYTHYLLNLITL